MSTRPRVPVVLAAALGLALAGSAPANCVLECDLACLWREYLAKAKESADDMARAQHYADGEAAGYQQALDAAQGELESMIPSIEGMIEEGIIGEACSKIKGQLERLNRVYNALTGLQGAPVLNRMAKIARDEAARNWRIARGRLVRYRWCCKNKKPKPSPPDPAPPPTPEEEPQATPVLTPGTLDQVKAARDRAKAGGTVGAADLAPTLHGRVLFWNLVALHRAGGNPRLAPQVAALGRHADELVKDMAAQLAGGAAKAGKKAGKMAPRR